MANEIRILKNRQVTINGELVTVQEEVGKTSLEQLQADLAACTQQLQRMQELVALVNHKIDLVNNAGENDFIVL